MREAQLQVGMRVKVDNSHKLRGGHLCEVVEFKLRRGRQNHWRVKFDEELLGGGFSEPGEEGQFLWFDAASLQEVHETHEKQKEALT